MFLFRLIANRVKVNPFIVSRTGTVERGWEMPRIGYIELIKNPTIIAIAMLRPTENKINSSKSVFSILNAISNKKPGTKVRYVKITTGLKIVLK
jgi:hypothetical protein